MSLTPVAQSTDNSIEVTIEPGPVPEEPGLTDADLARLKAEIESETRAGFASGKAAAEKDIKADRFRIRAFGKLAGKTEIDSVTGFPIERIGLPYRQTIFSHAEVNGYNSTMRDWHAKQLRRRRSNEALQPTAGRRDARV
jgi:hypothetical protein